MTINRVMFLTGLDPDKLSVRLDVTMDGTEHKIEFVHHVGHTLACRVLRDDLDGTFDRQVQDMRRAEYESGWRDAKARSRKRDWFSIHLNGKVT